MRYNILSDILNKGVYGISFILTQNAYLYTRVFLYVLYGPLLVRIPPTYKNVCFPYSAIFYAIVYFRSWVLFAISKSQKLLTLPDHQLAENLILVFCFFGRTKTTDKSKLITKLVKIIAMNIFIQKCLSNSMLNLCYTVFFQWSLETQNRK